MRRTVLLLLLGAAGCLSRPDGTVAEGATGVVTVDWQMGDSTGRFTAPGVAGWCEARRELLLTAQRADTGVAFTAAWDGTPAPGTLGIAAATLPRAQAAWRTADRTVLRAWRADSGTLELRDVGTLDGTLGARLASAQLDGAPAVRLTLTVRGVPVRPDSVCAASAAVPAPPVPGESGSPPGPAGPAGPAPVP